MPMTVKPFRLSLAGATCASTLLFLLGAEVSALARVLGIRSVWSWSAAAASAPLVESSTSTDAQFDASKLDAATIAVTSEKTAHPVSENTESNLLLQSDSYLASDSNSLSWTQRPLSQHDTYLAETRIVEPAMNEQTVAQTSAPNGADRDEAIRQQLYVDIDENILLDRPQPVPTSSFLTPSAYGADWGDAFISVSGVTEGDRSDLDGSISLGIGLGDAEENVGVEVAVGIISLDGFAEDGIVGAKLHKVFPRANNLGVAIGWANPVKWGAAEDEEDTFYGVLTHRLDLRRGQRNPVPLTTSLGVGTGTFRSNGAIAAGENTPNVFGSLGLRVIPEVSVVTSWTGNSLGAAVSTAPLAVPLVLTAGVSDITDNTVEGPRFHGSIGYSLSF